MATSRISNTILGPTGTAQANVRVVAKLMPAASFRLDTYTEVARIVETTTNSAGFWQLDLERQANINPADTTWYEITEYVADSAGGKRTWNISVGASDQTLYASLVTPLYNQPIIISTDQSTYLTQQSADARYQALSAIGATPNVIEPDDAAAAGVSPSAARADHEHGIVAAAPSAIGLAGTNSEGAATSFARSNHVHAYNPPACRVYNAGAQTIPDAATTVITFDSERYDSDTMHSTSSLTNRITFNTAGVYSVTGHIEVSGADYSSLYLFIRLNGVTTIAAQGTGAFVDGALNAIPLSVTTAYKFSASDYVELLFWQNNTAAAARSIIAGNRSPEFSATWIGTGN